MMLKMGKRKGIRRSLVICLTTALLGCKEVKPIDKQAVLQHGETRVEIEFSKCIRNEHGTGFSYLLFGKMVVHNTGKDSVSLDLNEIQLRIGDLNSSKIYIDSKASWILQLQQIAPEKNTISQVYWSFEDARPDVEHEEIMIMYFPAGLKNIQKDRFAGPDG